MQKRLSRRSFFRGVGALGAMALAGRPLHPKANEPTPLQAAGAVADWPEWRGRGRLGVWTESGILDRFPAQGLQVVWRTPVHSGYAGPAVAGGRVFVADYAQTRVLRGVERILTLDAGTGRTLWSREWETSYIGMLDTWAIGPGATPTVDGDRVYVLGRGGALSCLKVDTGNVVWQKDYMKDYGAEMPTWGFTGAPLVDGNRLICLVGGAAECEGRGVRQDVGPGNLACAAVELRARLRAADHHQRRRHASTDHLASCGRQLAGSGHRTRLLGAAVQDQLRDDGADGRAGRIAPAGVVLLQRLAHAVAGRAQTGSPRAVEGQERQRSPDRRTARRRSPRRSSTAITSTGCAATASFAVSAPRPASASGRRRRSPARRPGGRPVTSCVTAIGSSSTTIAAISSSPG